MSTIILRGLSCLCPWDGCYAKISFWGGGHPGVIIRKFGDDWSKTVPEGLFSPEILWLW